MKIFLLMSFLFLGCHSLQAEVLSFQSADGLIIEADLYSSELAKTKGVILLCHQAGWSKGEYKETGKWLSSLGFAAVATNQRSGGKINGVVNLTHRAAKKKKLKTDYLSARVDIEHALRFLEGKFKQKIILLGSSYSAALALRLAGERNKSLRAVASFSPGEYFSQKNYISELLHKISIPTFITASKQEMAKDINIWKKVSAKNRTLYIPKVEGFHGARALWTNKTGHEGYREALLSFLNSLK